MITDILVRESQGKMQLQGKGRCGQQQTLQTDHQQLPGRKGRGQAPPELLEAERQGTGSPKLLGSERAGDRLS